MNTKATPASESSTAAPTPQSNTATTIQVSRFSAERLAGRFHMDLVNGSIWLADRRMLLLQAEWFMDLRSELVNRLGAVDARHLLTQLGYRSGTRDALLAIRLNPDMDLLELLKSGGSFHAFQGTVAVVPTVVDIDLKANHCHIEFIWKNSIEGHPLQQHPSATSSSHEPACWMEVGYAAGFVSTIIGRQVIVREVECPSIGSEHCRCIARFTHEWDDPREDLKFLDVSSTLPQGSEGLSRETATSLSIASLPETSLDDDAPLVGRSGSFASTIQQLRRVARTDATILLLGESGVGKSALAAHAHQISLRAAGPFVEVNCAAIPEALLEAELFGVEKGAYTGAHAQRSGRFEDADGGTLFLDEIGLLPSSAQGKLLRALQAQKFERLGSSRTRSVDVRLVVATNLDLHEAVRVGTFRSDLFYRINVFPIHVPPLRERAGDVPLLVERLIHRFCRKYNLPPTGLTPQAYRKLLQHTWPGNIRELENAIERAVILAEPGQPLDRYHFSAIEESAILNAGLWLDGTGHLDPSSLTEHSEDAAVQGDGGFTVDGSSSDGGLTLLDLEKKHISAAIRTCGGNIGKAAKLLGLTRAQIDYRLKKWGWQ